MWNYFTHANTRRLIDILPKLVSAYNKATHRTIDMAPIDVDKEVEVPMWLTQESLGVKPQVKGVDHLRVSKVKSVFGKGYLPNWTEEVFTVISVGTKEPIQIKIKDYAGNEIDGSYYKQEVQVVDKPEMYRIERIIRTRKVGGVKRI